MNIYLDMDDVLCDTAGAYLGLLSQEFGLQVEFEQIFSFDLQKSFGLNDQQNRHLFARAHEAEFIRGLQPIDGMAGVLQNWMDQDFRISILTGRHTAAAKASRQWLEDYSIPHHSFTMVDKYQWRGTDKTLAISLEQMSRMRFDAGVEDAPKMADYLSRRMATPVLLFDRPWNRSYQLPANSRRCIGWQEVETALCDWPAESVTGDR